ncbi:hypothetical protein GCM10022140_34150 [Rhodococcus aetherivorans]
MRSTPVAFASSPPGCSAEIDLQGRRNSSFSIPNQPANTDTPRTAARPLIEWNSRRQCPWATSGTTWCLHRNDRLSHETEQFTGPGHGRERRFPEGNGDAPE